MSGLLHRLAAQALGSRNTTLHPLTALPYTIAPASPVHNAEADRAYTASWPMTKLGQPEAGSVAEMDRLAAREKARNSIHADIAEQAPDNANEVMPSSAEILLAQSASVFTTGPDRNIAPPSPLKSRPQQTENNLENTLEGESPIQHEVNKSQIPLNHAASKFIANDPPLPAHTDNVFPPPLLPLTNPARPPAINSAAVARHGEPGISTRQSRVEETTEVHVSIGRIEVTAVHEAAPPKRAERPAPKPVSLDEYLSKHQGSKG